MAVDYKTVVYYEPEDNTFMAYHPELGSGSCYAIGETKEEAIKLLEEAKNDFIKYLLDNGYEIPISQAH